MSDARVASIPERIPDEMVSEAEPSDAEFKFFLVGALVELLAELNFEEEVGEAVIRLIAEVTGAFVGDRDGDA